MRTTRIMSCVLASLSLTTASLAITSSDAFACSPVTWISVNTVPAEMETLGSQGHIFFDVSNSKFAASNVKMLDGSERPPSL